MIRRVECDSVEFVQSRADSGISLQCVLQEPRGDVPKAITKEVHWGRMAIVDTKPFKLRVILHRIFVERPQVTGIPAWPGGAACYRRSRYIL